MRLLARLAILVVLLIAITLAGGYIYLRSGLPPLSGSIKAAGLQQPVEIVRDRHGIPHIFATGAADAYFALGYVHAQDRLWQMEMNRRIAAGRLAEAFGAAALDTDKFLRTLGVRRVAEASLPLLDAETRQILDAYCAGVNAAMKRRGPLPVEFLLTGITPEPWTPADSISWVKMMAWDLSGNWSREVFRARLAKRLSPEQIEEFLPPYPGDAPIALSSLGKLYQDVTPQLERLAAVAPPPLPSGTGSNNWVVAGNRSASGRPLLANDPHLGLSTPSLWYFAHLDAPDLKVIGASLPGVPMIVLGRTARLAWGFTNTGPDTQDLFIEKIDPADPTKYLTPDGARAFETRSEVIKVKGGDDVTLKVRISRHGPIVSDVSKSVQDISSEGHAIAFSWTALRDDDLTLQAGTAMGRAENWQGFVNAARSFHSPQQNMVYADIDGNIGYIAPARIPIRAPENDIRGLFPAPGWIAKYDWQGFVPFDELPRSFNPPSGKIVTANHKIVPDSYPHFLTSEWAEPYRARRIEQVIASRPTHSVHSFADLQADIRSGMVDDFLPLLLQARAASPRAEQAMAMLKGWDGSMQADRPEPLIVKAWLRQLAKRIYRDELGDELFARAWDERPIFLYNVLRDVGGQSRWCDDIDTDAKESCAEQVAAALEQALEDLTARYGQDLRAWRWGIAHTAVSEHRPLSNQALLKRFFELRVPTPGDTYTVNVGKHVIADQANPFVNRHAASLRAIYDLADLDRSQFIHSTGQSGSLFSPLYNNFVERWAKVEYVPMSMRRADAEAGALGTLQLRP